MTRLQRILALVLSVGSAPLLSACGGSGSGGGNFQSPGLGTITLVSFAPNPILGCDPVPFTITGNNFQTVTGTTARITWRALGGAVPFAHGTTDRVTTLANVTSNTTIDGLSPHVLICGVPNILVEIDVALESGVTASSTGIFQVQIDAPAITAINPNPLPAAIATPFSITGTGFPASGGPVTIRFTGDAGALLFNDGTHNYVDVQGVVTSTTNINATSPIATVCGVNAVTLAQLGASIQLFFPDGCCTLPTVPGFVNFLAPQITTLVPNSVPAELPPANLVLNGFNFGPPNSIATVRFIGDANVALFNDGTLNTIDVPGLIGPSTFPNPQTITLISPTAAVCNIASRTAAIRVISPFGSSCRQSNPAFVTFTAPVITTVNNLAQATVPAHIPTQIFIQGTGFGPANGLCSVTFISDPVSPGIFGDGTQIESAPVQGVINAAGTQITVTTPNATVENAASRFASIRVNFQGDSCASSGPQVVQFTAATLAAIAATAPTAGTFFAAVPTSFSLTGQNFGPAGSEVFVRFVADNGATPFGNGTQNAFEVPGRVTVGGPGAGTITGVAPLAALCPALTLGATVRVLFQDGGQASNTVPLTFTAPSIVFAPLSFPGSVANAFTITGTGFGPANSLVAVKFTATGNLTPFGDGTLNEVTVTGTINGAGTQITGITPLATLCGVASITATVSTTFQGGACASTAVGAVTITAPTINANGFAPASVPAAIPTAFTITGTGYGVNGQPAQVTFSVNPPALPFNNGSASEVTVSGTVGGGGTTITGFTPGVTACPNNVVADVRVTLQNGACTGPLSPGVTFRAPTVTSNTLTLPLVSLQSPGLFTINGADFGPTSGQAIVRWTASAPIFGDGTLTSIDAPGSVTGTGTITTTLPVARLCTTNATATARVILPMGACADSPANFVTWTAPAITTTTPLTTSAYAPASIAITGTTFPVVGTPVAVTFSNAGQVFNNGTSTTETVLGVVNPANTITVTPPAALACANVAAAISVQFGASNGVSGGCAQAAPTLTLNVPSTFVIAPVSTPALAPGLISVTGANFPAVNTPVQIRLTATAPAGATPFGGGTQSTVTIGGTVTAANTVAFTPPVCCNAANLTIQVGLTFQNANCEFAAGSYSALAPTITSITPGTSLSVLAPAQITLNGANLPPNAAVTVNFAAAAGAPFNGGTVASTSIPAVVNGAGTAIGPFTPPLAMLCGATSVVVTPSVFFPSTTCALVSPVTLTYNAPAITAFATSGTGGGANIARQTLQNAFTITGTGYAPVGAPVIVRFARTAGATTPFQGGLSDTVDVVGLIATATTITGVTPLATATTSFTATVQAYFLDGTCTNAFASVTFNAPPVITDVTPDLLVREGGVSGNRNFLSRAAGGITVSGTGFAVGSTLLVFEQANGPIDPIGSGALSQQVLTGSTTFTGITPTDTSVVVPAQAGIRVANPDGQAALYTHAQFLFRPFGHYQNRNVSLLAGQNSEMEAAVDPTNPLNMATISHLSGLKTLRFAYTTDGGRVWNRRNLGNADDGLPVGDNRVDPRVAYDRFGNLYACYFNSSTFPRQIVVMQSFDKGATFPVANRRTAVSAATGIDKEFLVTGPNGANLAQEAIYVGWDDTAGSGGIDVAGATCTGAGIAQSAYSAPVQIVDAGFLPLGQKGPNADVGPNGDLHVVWNHLSPNGFEGPGAVYYDRDPLGLFAGASFGTDTLVTPLGGTEVGWNETIPAMAVRKTFANPEVAVVRTGPKAGRVVFTFGTESPAESDDTEISSLYSDNNGLTLSPILVVNDDITVNSQFQASVRADPATGDLFVAWYDCRNAGVGNNRTQVYCATTQNGGDSWLPNMLLADGITDPTGIADGNQLGDYLGLATFNGFALCCFSDASNSTGDNADGTSQVENYATRFQYR